MVPKDVFSTCHRQSDPAFQTGEVFCVVQVKMEDAKGWQRSGYSWLIWTNK